MSVNPRSNPYDTELRDVYLSVFLKSNEWVYCDPHFFNITHMVVVVLSYISDDIKQIHRCGLVSKNWLDATRSDVLLYPRLERNSILHIISKIRCTTESMLPVGKCRDISTGKLIMKIDGPSYILRIDRDATKVSHLKKRFYVGVERSKKNQRVYEVKDVYEIKDNKPVYITKDDGVLITIYDAISNIVFKPKVIIKDGGLINRVVLSIMEIVERRTFGFTASTGVEAKDDWSNCCSFDLLNSYQVEQINGEDLVVKEIGNILERRLSAIVDDPGCVIQ